MSNKKNRTARQIRESRLVIVAELHKKGYSYEQIRQEVMRRENLSSYSKSIVHKDVQLLLKEWRDTRLEDTDLLVQEELEKIRAQEYELWQQWEKSKTDVVVKSSKKKGKAGSKGKIVNKHGEMQDDNKIITTDVEATEKTEVMLGDPRYQDAINRLGIERRKLLGLYAVEKKEITGKDGSPIFNGFDAFMASCKDVADNDGELNEATQQETTDSAG